jgi:stress response protein YsnF
MKQHILVAAFDRFNEAEQVKRELLSKGVSQTDIKMAASNEGDMVDSTTNTSLQAGTDATHNDSMTDKVGNFFRSIFSDNDTRDSRYADTYPEAVRRGSTVVTVMVNDDAQVSVIEEIMERNGAIDIDERSANWTNQGLDASATMGSSAATAPVSGDYPNTQSTLGLGSTTMTDRASSSTELAGTEATGHTTIPVMEEELKVGKRENSLGRVRVVSRMTERPVEETVNLSEQHAVIERRPVDRAVSTAELSAFKEGAVEIQETAEEPVVEKTARVVEEVMVGKETTQHDETIRDTVRRTDVDIENDAAAQTGMRGTDHMDATDPTLPTKR